MKDRFVTVILTKPKLVHGDQYGQYKWTQLQIGHTYRCPVDEAYTMVQAGLASYPDGIEILRKMVYEDLDLSGRVDSLEERFKSLSKISQLSASISTLWNRAKSFMESYGVIAGILSILSAGLTYAFSQGWIQF